MNRINKLFDQKKNNILSIYFTAGYPQLNDTTQILKSLEKNGVDLVEIGIPFSDPIADGPTIQQSNHIALQNGMSIRKLFNQLSDIRNHIQIPLVLMGYLNPIMRFGFDAFCQSCQQVGIDGIIIPDLPMSEYLNAYKGIAEAYALKFIFLITPETSEERIRAIDNNTDGFIYMVSSAAVTGTQQSFDDRLAYFNRINAMHLKNPRLIGFGVSNKSTLTMVNQYASGAIVGSAFIKTLEQSAQIENAVEELMEKLSR